MRTGPAVSDRGRKVGILSAVVSTVTGVSEQDRKLYRFELEPEVRDWLDSLSDGDFKRVDEVCGSSRRRAAGPGPITLRARCGNFASGYTRWRSG
jgi:hypothetical protein